MLRARRRFVCVHVKRHGLFSVQYVPHHDSNGTVIAIHYNHACIIDPVFLHRFCDHSRVSAVRCLVLQVLLNRAADLDQAVAGGRGTALAEAAVTLGSSLAVKGASYAQSVVADFNKQRGSSSDTPTVEKEGNPNLKEQVQ